MPNIKSAIKRVKVTRKRTLRNARLKSALRTAIRKFESAAGGTSREEAGQALHKALVAIDKAVTKGILHKNTAARKKSRLTKRFNKQAG
ncbi:30S ribosomal protein S20 [Desulfotomaculum copahuensis]|uniref:Small ribosomal subunit protein bS20 n=1 Tax=Desulfotomaculum copahuensis TaxID=1838280 RepID=A0A1B7LFA3_9FIRM|nr:30S ribosomal protein S20 [Desulfotomaculum copahuensis]OAT82317.1 30S ribosomal protein S20 [Desulfotomaculum copahuensis]